MLIGGWLPAAGMGRPLAGDRLLVEGGMLNERVAALEPQSWEVGYWSCCSLWDRGQESR